MSSPTSPAVRPTLPEGLLLHRRRLLHLAGGASALALAARAGLSPVAAAARSATPAATIDRSQVGGTLVVAPVDADTLDPAYSSQSSAETIFGLVFDTLIGYDKDLGFEPLLAESMAVSEDGLKATFTIRQGLTFHDGSPVDAEAVKFTFDRNIKAYYVDIIEAVEAPDASTVVVTLLAPSAVFFADLTSPFFGIVSKKAAEEAGDAFGDRPVGSGPFVFQDWTVGEKFILSRNETYQYFGSLAANTGAPYLDGVELRTIAEAQTLVASLEAGEVQLSTAEGSEFDDLQGNPDYQFFTAQRATGITVLNFSMTLDGDKPVFKEIFQDVRVRQAIGHALNAQEIIDGLLGGHATPSLLPLPVGAMGWSEELEQEIGYPYDPEKAAQLLDEAGWTLDGAVRKKDGKPFQISLWTNSSTTRQRASELLQNQLAQVGITVTIEAIELGSYLARLADGDADTYLIQFGGTDPDLLDGMTQADAASGFRNYQAYNPAFATLLAQGRITLDVAKRTDIYVEAQKLLMADPLVIPLLSFFGPTVARSEVKGLAFTPFGGMLLQDVSIEQ